MAANSKDQDKFDQMLGVSLRRHSEAVPADFTERMLQQVREVDARRVLKRVVWQERIGLAGSIFLGFAAIIGALVFPGRIVAAWRSVGGGLAELGGRLAERIPQTVQAVGGEWQFYAVLAVVLAFAVYFLLDLLAGDRLRMM